MHKLNSLMTKDPQTGNPINIQNMNKMNSQATLLMNQQNKVHSKNRLSPLKRDPPGGIGPGGMGSGGF